MNAFSAFLSTAFGGLVALLAQRVTLGTARLLAFVAAYLGILGLLFFGIKASILGLLFFVDNKYLLMGFYIFWPDNAETVFSIVLTTDFMVFIYRIHVEHIRETMKMLGF